MKRSFPEASDATKEEVLALRAKGMTMPQICEALRVGTHKVARWLYEVEPKAANLTPRPYRTGLVWAGVKRGRAE